MSPEQRDELVRELMCVEGKYYNGDEFYDCAEDHEGDTVGYECMLRVVRRVEERYELADRDELAALESENAALRAIERLTEGVCPHCKLPLIHGDTVTMGMDGKTWHAGCVEQLARQWKRGKRSWRP